MPDQETCTIKKILPQEKIGKSYVIIIKKTFSSVSGAIYRVLSVQIGKLKQNHRHCWCNDAESTWIKWVINQEGTRKKEE